MNIIFHHPLPLNLNATSASGIRPIKMIEAFRSLGYQVDIVAGYSSERKDAIAMIKKNILTGTRYDFVYSESSTMPTLLTDRHHIPLHPKIDFSFFEFCKKSKIPIGLFYRDIYWIFQEYSKKTPLYKSVFAKFFYRYDLKKYEQLVDKVYLPSLQMAEYIPIVSHQKFAALPPGHSGKLCAQKLCRDGSLNLLYVGGIGNHYQMQELFLAIQGLPHVHFTLCTRKPEWTRVQAEYLMPLPLNINIVHNSGKELQELYDWSDIAMLFVKPYEYREFASPFKLYEYMGQAKPIIASKYTLAGEFVCINDIGWEIEYNAKSLRSLLERLLKQPDEIDAANRQLVSIASLHSWSSRAKQVACDMESVK